VRSLRAIPGDRFPLSPETRTALFLGAVTLLTFIAVRLVSSAIVWTEESRMFGILWVAGFGFLFFGVAFLFSLSVLRPFLKETALKGAYIKEFPKTAIVYPVRNESHGLFERIEYSFSGNKLPNTDLWILSDSSAEFEPYEREIVAKLSASHPDRIFYRRREAPVERKQGNIAEFLSSHREYVYLYVCDADGMIPKGTLLKLLRKAEHPDNRDIAIFQAFIRIAHAASWYARFEKIGANFAQRFNFASFQAIFGRTISFGHHHLVRAGILSRIKLPRGLLSHDNWDTVLLDQMGYRVAFCADVHAYDEAPSNYLEARARARRWARGTLQGIPLIFMPKVSLASRFLAFFGIYLYAADVVFFFWLIFGLLAHSCLAGELIHFEIDSIWLGACTNSKLKWTLLFSIAVVYFHKLCLLKNWKDLKDFFYELVLSTFLTLNNVFYTPLDIASIPLRKLHWQPMAKNPFARVDLQNTAKILWPGTAAGLLGLYFCLFLTPYFIWQATPLLTSLILSIPVAYWTARSVPERCKAWI